MSPVPKASPWLISENVKTLAADGDVQHAGTSDLEMVNSVDAAAITYLLPPRRTDRRLLR